MMAYYGNRISPHKTKTPEGFLICHDVPISRTGKQIYLRSELNMEGEGKVTILRPEEEVFSPAAMASFEGKPVTAEHPCEMVSAENYQMYNMGHCQNVHRGKGSESDLLLADLVVSDQEAIRLIESGECKEVSCGYNCEYVPDGDGHFIQRGIRGNHVAIVAAGRAGHRVSIKDSMPTVKGVRPNMSKPSIFGKMFASWTKDEATDPEDVAAAVDEMIAEDPEQDPEATDASPVDPGNSAVPQTNPNAMPMKDGGNDQLIALLTQAIALLKNGAADSGAAAKDPLQAFADELAGGAPEDPEQDPEATDADPEGEESVTLPAEEMDEAIADLPENPLGANGQSMDSRATIAAIKAVRPYILRMNAADQRAASNAMINAVRRATGRTASTRDDYSAILNSRANSARRRAAKRDESEIGEAIMKARNPHYQSK